jgi:hypothetical protein
MRILFILLTLLFALPAFAQDDTKITTSFEPEGDIYVGQTVRLWVEISTSGKITTPPQYPELKVDGAISLLPELGAVSFSDGPRIGLRQRYVIIPQRAGTVTAPPLEIEFGAEIDGQTTVQTLSTTPEPFEAIVPPGAENLDRIVTSSDLKATEAYDREFTDLKTGDAITRTVSIVAGGTFALALPEVNFQPIAGAKQYPATPQLGDSSNRGQYRATRIDAASYVFETAGETGFPEIVVQWFDPDSKSIKETVLPAVDLTVAVNPAFAESTTQQAAGDTKTRLLHQMGRALAWLKNNIVMLTILAIAAYLIRLVWVRYSPIVAKAWRSHREKILKSEQHAFKMFQKACRSGDSKQSKTTFWQWLDHFVPPNETASLVAMSQKFPELDTNMISNILSSTTLGNTDLAALKSATIRLRTSLLAGPSETKSTPKYALNPRHP